jgi:hypothetical protein
MSHYAKVVDGKVTQVIVAEADFFNTFVDTSPGAWIQTSYNTRGGVHHGPDGNPDSGIALRGNYAGIGHTYDQVNDVFYAPRPLDRNGVSCASWTISSPTWLWTAPTAMPAEGGPYVWDEPTKAWVAVATPA